MTDCTISISAVDPAGTVLPNGVMIFVPVSDAFVPQGAQVMWPSGVSVLLDGAGAGSVTLKPGTYAYQGQASGVQVIGRCLVPSQATATLADCIENAGGEIPPASVIAAQDARDEAIAARDEIINGGGLGIPTVTVDPAPLADGMVWQRSDLGQLRGRVGGRTVILSEDQDEAITALVTTTSEGLAATADGQLFAVAAGGSIAIYRRFGGAAVLVRSNSQAVPVPISAPGAPAIVASAQALKNGGVPLKSILGRGYSSGNDGAATLNAQLPGIVAAGLTVRDTDQMVVACTSSLVSLSNLQMDLSSKTVFARKFDGSAALFQSLGTLTPANRVSSMHIRGGVFLCEDDEFGGHLFVCGMDDCTLDGVQTLGFRRRQSGEGGHGMRLWGDRNRILRPYVSTTYMTTGTAGIRWLGGDGNIVCDFFVQSGDDAVQFVPVTGDDTSPFWGMSMTRSAFSRGYVRSASKAFIAALSSSISSVTGYAGLMRGLTFEGIRGEYGTFAGLIENVSGDATIEAQVDDIVIRDVRLSRGSAQTIATSGDALKFSTGWTGGVRRISLGDVTIDASQNGGSKNALGIYGDGIRVHRSGPVNLTGAVRAVRIAGPNTDAAMDGAFSAATAGDATDDADRHVIQIDAAAAGSIMRLPNRSLIAGVNTPSIGGVTKPMAGVFVGAGSRLIAGDITVRKAAGAAAGTNGLHTKAGAVAIYDSLSGTFDALTSGGGVASQSRAAVPSSLIRSGRLDLAATSNASFGLSDLASLVSLTGTFAAARALSIATAGALDGDTIVFVREGGGAGIVTVQHSSASGLGVIGTLTGAGTFLTITFDAAQGRFVAGVRGAAAGGSSAWGGITGSLSAQTDLQAALDGKQPITAVLTATTAAFTTAQETKLAGIATGATANATDAALRDRATHTGTQAASTITGLAAVATDGTFASLTDKPTTLAGYGISGAGLMVTGGAGTWARFFGANSGTNTVYGSAIILTPYYLPTPLTLDRLGCEITTAGASGVVGDLCIYDSDPATSRPRNLLAATATFAADATGAKTAAITGGSVAIPQGGIWLGIRVSGQCSWRQAQNLAVIGGDAAPIAAPTTLASLVRYFTWGSVPPSTWTYSASERHLISAHVFWGRQA